MVPDDNIANRKHNPTRTNKEWVQCLRSNSLQKPNRLHKRYHSDQTMIYPPQPPRRSRESRLRAPLLSIVASRAPNDAFAARHPCLATRSPRAPSSVPRREDSSSSSPPRPRHLQSRRHHSPRRLPSQRTAGSGPGGPSPRRTPWAPPAGDRTPCPGCASHP